MEWYGTLAASIVVVLFGALFVRRHMMQIESFRNDDEINAKLKLLLISQQKLRIVTSVLVTLVGMLMPLTYHAIVREQRPLLSLTLILVMLVLLAAIVFLAIADLIATRSGRVDLQLKKAETELKRRMLENDLESFQQAKARAEAETEFPPHGNNGHSS